MFYKNGILIQEVSPQMERYHCENFHNAGASAYYAFPLTGRTDRKSLTLKRRLAQGDKLIELIDNLELAREYVAYCTQLQIPIRVLFIETAHSDILWKDGDLPMTLLGYECAYMDMSDPEYCWFLDQDHAFAQFLHQLNKNGLFETEQMASAYREEIYRVYPDEEEECAYQDGFVARISEIQLNDLLKEVDQNDKGLD